jgi:predicted nuclease of restriction endonuclease-like (RecB) superfamily
MNEYFKQIDELITNRETTRKVRNYVENEENLITYWNIGKMLSIVGTKYGEGTIKKWSIIFTSKYGKSYNYRNLLLMIQYYTNYKNMNPMGSHLNIAWSNLREIIKIKSKNGQTYYLNLCIQNNLTKRELIDLIKNNTYEKLPYNDRKNIDVDITNNNNSLIPIKNPLIINIPTNNLKEKVLLKYFEEHLKEFLTDLGIGYTYAASEYLLVDENTKYKIDMLLFNTIKLCYVVVELKVRKLQNKDIDQIINYMNLVDKIKKPINKTRGILITKEDNGYKLSYCNEQHIERTTYLNIY